MEKRCLKQKVTVAAITLILCAASCFAQEDSYEMESYLGAVKTEARHKAMRGKTADEIDAAMGCDMVVYPREVLTFGVGLYEGLAKIRSNGKVGYIRSDGKIAIAAKFDEGSRFSEGLARVLIDGKWGFIDRTGRFVISPGFEWASGFHEGRALVKVGDKWGFINRRGRIVISARYHQVSSFSEGLAAVMVYNGRYKTGYIDTSGNWILLPTFDGGSDFHEGRAVVGKDIGYDKGVISESYVITRSGQRLFELRSWYLTSYSEGLLVVANKEREFGFIDLNGNLVIPHQFRHAHSFSEGLAAVRVHDKPVFINKEGEVVLRPEGDCSGEFSTGLAPCASGGKAGFIDRTGKFVIEQKFDWAYGFSGELAAVFVGEKVGYINRTGEYVWTPTE